jgi:hypothetical protein
MDSNFRLRNYIFDCVTCELLLASLDSFAQVIVHFGVQLNVFTFISGQLIYIR